MATERLTIGQRALNRDQHPGVARMLVGDAYITVRLVKEALRRIAGVPSDASFLTTMFAIGVVANALRRIAAPALRVFRPRHPSFADTMIAVAVLRETPRGIAGVRATDTPDRSRSPHLRERPDVACWITAALLALAFIATLFQGPAAR